MQKLYPVARSSSNGRAIRGRMSLSMPLDWSETDFSKHSRTGAERLHELKIIDFETLGGERQMFLFWIVRNRVRVQWMFGT